MATSQKLRVKCNHLHTCTGGPVPRYKLEAKSQPLWPQWEWLPMPTWVSGCKL